MLTSARLYRCAEYAQSFGALHAGSCVKNCAMHQAWQELCQACSPGLWSEP